MSYTSELEELLGDVKNYKLGDEQGTPSHVIKNDPSISQVVPESISLSPCICVCPFVLSVFAQTSFTDAIFNDKNSFIYYGFDSQITAITIVLQKRACGTAEWSDIVTINNEAYGKFFAYGKSPNLDGSNFTDDLNKLYTGFQIDWREILLNFDSGNYRLEISYTSIFGGDPTIGYSQEFCLNEYDKNKINRTVRIETITQGIRGTLNDINSFIDYGTKGWYDQIRLKGILFAKPTNYVKEYNQYGTIDNNVKKPVINEQVPKYQLDLRSIPGWVDCYLSTNVLQADEIYITDYNSVNRQKYISLPVINDGDFVSDSSTDNMTDENLLSPATLSFAFGRNNLRKRN